MTKHKKLINTDDELLIQRYKSGIKLLKPDEINSLHAPHRQLIMHNVGTMLALPINVYFLNSDSVIQNINETTIATCGYKSVKDTLGKTVRIAAKKESADFSINHDRKVLETNVMKIAEESFSRKSDEIHLHAISFKFPWYNYDNKIIGVFGCSIVIGDQAVYPLADSLSLLTQTGLLSAPEDVGVSGFLPGSICENMYFSSRETECIHYLVKGKTCKQIANILGLSYRTIEHYLENIKKKMNVRSKSEVIEKVLSQFAK